MPEKRTQNVLIKSGEKELHEYVILSADVYTEANRIPWAEIVILDGDAAKREFAVSKKGDFDLGKEIEITMSYVNVASSSKSVFKGVVTKQTVEFDVRGICVRIECRHAAHLLTKVRKSVTFANQNDAQIIGTLKLPGKNAITIAGGLTGVQHKQIVQFQATDWDFLMSRCQANGWLVIPTTAGLTVMMPTLTDGSSDEILDFNHNEIYNIELGVDASYQCASATASGWNFVTQKSELSAKEVGADFGAEAQPAGKVPMLVQANDDTLVSAASLEVAELNAWTRGVMNMSRLAYLRGRFELQGDATVVPGKACKIINMGAKLDGKGFITAVRQRMHTGGWSTDVQIGIPPTPFYTERNISSPPAAGLLPGVTGLQIGVVEQWAEDKDGGTRVKVKLPAMGDQKEAIWARLGMPMAGKATEGTRGMLFWPEVGDEVILGFLNDDPRAAIILGSLYNGVSKPIFPSDKDNALSGIWTKGGSKFQFNDKAGEIAIELSTKEMFEVKLDEKAKSILVKDKKTANGATLEMGEKGITMSFGKCKFTMDDKGITLAFDEKNTISMKAGGIEVSTGSKLTLKGEGADLLGGSKVLIKGDAVSLE